MSTPEVRPGREPAVYVGTAPDDIPARPVPDRVVWFNCAAGVAGDMVMASLVDAGADPDAVADAIAALGVDGYALGFESVQRCGIRSTWANVVIDHFDELHAAWHHGRDHQHPHEHPHEHDHDHEHEHEHGHGHPHRPAREVLELIARADLAPRIKARAASVYRTLAEAEGLVHGIDPDEVELHEVGALDSIIDVVGVCAALESLGIDRVECSPIALGHGTVTSAHGQIPNPPPAVVYLLASADAPVIGLDTDMETATPTGVAAMVALSSRFGAIAPMSIEATGFGAGTADVAGRPNVVQAIIGTATTSGSAGGPGRPAHQLEANVDDATGEVLSHTVAALIEAGAHDAWVTPIVMKKGRPAHTVHALCDDASMQAVAAALLRETGSLGLRATSVERWPQARSEFVVEVGEMPVRVKISGDRIKVENDDAVLIAVALDLPLREVIARAESAARQLER